MDQPTPTTDHGDAYVAAIAEYVVRGGNPDDVMSRCPVCEQVNVPAGHRTPLGYDCPAAGIHIDAVTPIQD